MMTTALYFRLRLSTHLQSSSDSAARPRSACRKAQCYARGRQREPNCVLFQRRPCRYLGQGSTRPVSCRRLSNLLQRQPLASDHHVASPKDAEDRGLGNVVLQSHSCPRLPFRVSSTDRGSIRFAQSSPRTARLSRRFCNPVYPFHQDCVYPRTVHSRHQIVGTDEV